jgi:hypothetical protein
MSAALRIRSRCMGVLSELLGQLYPPLEVPMRGHCWRAAELAATVDSSRCACSNDTSPTSSITLYSTTQSRSNQMRLDRGAICSPRAGSRV